MNKFSIKLICFSLALLVQANAFAKRVDALYSASLPVANQSSQLREKTIVSLFESVLVKISGRSDVAALPSIGAQLPKAMSYIATFNYAKIDGAQSLTASFNESLVDGLLKGAGVSIWGAQRPTAMVWLTHEDANDQRALIADEALNSTAAQIKSLAKQRGMPMLLPLWDLEDQFSLSIAEVWGLFPDSVSNATVRYGTDFMVLAKVTTHGLSYQLNWAIYQQQESQGYVNIVASGFDDFISHPQAVAGLVHQTSDFFAKQYSVDTSAAATTSEFVVTNIDSIGRYVEVLNYLKSLKAVESVHLKHNKLSQFTFEAKLLGSVDSLAEVLRLEKRLVAIFDQTLSIDTYQWHQ